MGEIVTLKGAVLTDKKAQEIIRRLAMEGNNIRWSKHARERMKQRGVTTLQVINCLLKGTIIEPVSYSYSNGGGYVTKIRRVTAGELVEVALCLKLEGYLLIITVIN